MKSQGTGGFTLIEVILFFAITSALAAGVMVSASLGINTQRYRDAVTSLTAQIQQDFTAVTNPQNERVDINADVCSGVAAGVIPGATDCVIMGRLVVVGADGTITRSNLIGDEDPLVSTDTDITAIQKFRPQIDNATSRVDELKWDTRIRKTGTVETASIVILRSPRSGSVYSYVVHGEAYSSANQTVFDSFIANQLATTTLNRTAQYICVDSSGWMPNTTLAVKLESFTAGPNGVSFLEVEGSECD